MFEQLLARLGAVLERHELPYMIIGGQAVLLYGEPRLTRDIDITVGAGPEELQRVLAAAGELSLDPIPEDVPSFVRKTMVLPLVDGETGIRVDFIFSFTPYVSEAVGRAQSVSVGGQVVRFAAPEDVVIHKIFAGRPRDIEDVRSILLKNQDLDEDYMRRWLAAFDAAAEGGEGRGYVETLESLLAGDD